MPLKRRREHVEYGSTALLHLAIGDCLLAGRGDGCGCGLTLANGDFQMEVARNLWRNRKAEILAECPGGGPAWIATQLQTKRKA